MTSRLSATPPTRLDPMIIAGEAETSADQITLPDAREAAAVPQPANVESLWLDKEFGGKKLEQRWSWAAAGEEASRSARRTAAEQDLAATTAEATLANHNAIVEAVISHYLAVIEVLSAHRRRAKGSKIYYQLAKTGFILGDLSGFASAAIWLGEEIYIALLLALSAAVATVAAGLIGADLGNLQRRERRAIPANALSDAQKQFAHFFLASEASAHWEKAVIQVSIGTAAMIGVGIGALRAAVDDPLIGLIFAGIALAVAGGSFLVSYAGADEISDAIENARADYLRVIKEHRTLAHDDSWRNRAAAHVEAESMRTEHSYRGVAAEHRVRSLKNRVLRQNPHVAGHGPAAPVVGRTLRREEGR